MWTCPNCHHPEKFPTICSQCHFDGSSDILRYPTLVPLLSRAIPRKFPQKTTPVSDPDSDLAPVMPDLSTAPESVENPAIPDTIPALAKSVSEVQAPFVTTPDHSATRSFSMRLAATLAGTALCIGGAALALRFHKASLYSASSAVVSALPDSSNSTASSSFAESSSVSSAGTLSSEVQAYRNSKLYELFSSDTLYLESQCTTTGPFDNDSLSYQLITAHYQGMSYSKTTTDFQESTIDIVRDGFSYLIFSDQHLILKSATSTQSSITNSSTIEQSLMDGTITLTTSTKIIDGISYHAETLSGKLSKTIQDSSISHTDTETFCFEGDTLCYILIDTDTGRDSSSTQMKITRLSYDVDTSLFELPGYKVYTRSASGTYYDENGEEVDPMTLYS